MKIYVPYTALLDATRNFLAQCQVRGYQLELIDVSASPTAYLGHLRQRWAKVQAFINIEHDVVPWPGAVEELRDCPQPWCAFGYETVRQPFAQAPLGCVKFGPEFIAATPTMWEPLLPWHELDFHLWHTATAAGHRAHQHWPSVFNANTPLLASLRRNGRTDL